MAGRDKDAWLASIFGGSAPGTPRTGGSSGSSGSSLPAPKLDGKEKADELVISWRWPDAPPGQHDFEIRWRRNYPGSASSDWQRQRLGSTASFRHAIRDLQPNTRYAICVHAIPLTPSGQPAQTTELLVTTGPPVPTRLHVTGGTDTSVSLRWDGCGAGVRYAVYGSAALGFQKLYSGEEEECTVGNLKAGVEYGFRVCSTNLQALVRPPCTRVCCVPRARVRLRAWKCGTA